MEKPVTKEPVREWTPEIAEIVKNRFTKAIIEKLAVDFFLTGGEIEEDENLKEASHDCYELYWKNPRFEDIRSELEEKISLHATYSEIAGFRAGLHHAIDLLIGSVNE